MIIIGVAEEMWKREELEEAVNGWPVDDLQVNSLSIVPIILEVCFKAIEKLVVI